MKKALIFCLIGFLGFSILQAGETSKKNTQEKYQKTSKTLSTSIDDENVMVTKPESKALPVSSYSFDYCGILETLIAAGDTTLEELLDLYEEAVEESHENSE